MLKPTSLSIAVGKDLIRAGEATTVSGRLRRADSGAALAAQTVRLLARPKGAGSFTVVAKQQTSSTGRVSFRVTPTRDTEYRLRFARTDRLAAVSSRIRWISVRR